MSVSKASPTIQELAAQLYRALEQSERSDGTTFYHLSKTEPEREWMTDVIRTAHGSAGPDDTIYEWIHRAAGYFADSDDAADYDALSDSIYEMETDVYIHDLTAWLNRNINHVYYLTQVLEELGPFTGGFQLLMAAQAEQIHEVASALLDALNAIAGADDEESDDDDLPTLEQVENRLREENCLIVQTDDGEWVVLDADTRRISLALFSREAAMSMAYRMRYAE